MLQYIICPCFSTAEVGRAGAERATSALSPDLDRPARTGPRAGKHGRAVLTEIERVEELDGAPLKLDRSTTETGRPQNRSWGESEGEGRGAIVLALPAPAIVCGRRDVEVLGERRGRARRNWRWIGQQRSHRVMNG